MSCPLDMTYFHFFACYVIHLHNLEHFSASSCRVSKGKPGSMIYECKMIIQFIDGTKHGDGSLKRLDAQTLTDIYVSVADAH